MRNLTIHLKNQGTLFKSDLRMGRSEGKNWTGVGLWNMCVWGGGGWTKHWLVSRLDDNSDEDQGTEGMSTTGLEVCYFWDRTVLKGLWG